MSKHPYAKLKKKAVPKITSGCGALSEIYFSDLIIKNNLATTFNFFFNLQFILLFLHYTLLIIAAIIINLIHFLSTPSE